MYKNNIKFILNEISILLKEVGNIVHLELEPGSYFTELQQGNTAHLKVYYVG